MSRVGYSYLQSAWVCAPYQSQAVPTVDNHELQKKKVAVDAVEQTNRNGDEKKRNLLFEALLLIYTENNARK